MVMTPEISCLGGGQMGVAPSPWAGVLAALTVLGAHSCPVSSAPCRSLSLLLPLSPLNDLRIPVDLVYAHSFMPPGLFLRHSLFCGRVASELALTVCV